MKVITTKFQEKLAENRKEHITPSVLSADQVHSRGV